jgi:hypothetical protein
MFSTELRGEMKIQAYPAAKVVAPRLHDYFTRQHAEAVSRGEQAASVPDAETIEAVINATFWASLRREEGYIPRVSLALLPPTETPHPLCFERPLPLSPAALTRIAPAVERAGVHLGAWRNGHDLAVWGTTRSIPAWCLVLEVAAPGLMVIKHHRGDDSGKYTNVAVLEGDLIKIVDERASSLPDCPPLLQSLLGFDSPIAWVDSVNVLVQLAVSMRAHGHGGSLLVVPARTEAWRESIVRPIPYGIAPAYDELSALSRDVPDDAAEKVRWEERLRRAVDAVAGLTAVDGAAVISTDYEVLGFGAKITRRRGAPPIEQVTVTEPILGFAPAMVHPEELGGTRHLTAAQFVQDQRDAVALVASQDGRFTIFAWSPCEEMVHAHRVEALLL